MLDGPEPVLRVSDLRTVFATRDGEIHAVNGVSFAIAPGESGCTIPTTGGATFSPAMNTTTNSTPAVIRFMTTPAEITIIRFQMAVFW